MRPVFAPPNAGVMAPGGMPMFAPPPGSSFMFAPPPPTAYYAEEPAVSSSFNRAALMRNVNQYRLLPGRVIDEVMPEEHFLKSTAVRAAIDRFTKDVRWTCSIGCRCFLDVLMPPRPLHAVKAAAIFNHD